MNDKRDELVVWVLLLLHLGRGQEVEGEEAEGLVREGRPELPVIVYLDT